ncbi:uncharacterized protein NPIL_246881 [Nephila pilipes]|uniref:Mutator-like transposase domain-containing protein n=1 Tax=Nephila pilipes TaxID=299642 RepID=A0A8X6TGB2_NEPPI|nr:uncharacterized protein NPIL_246881 [Nephila pilipes]
MRCIGKGAESAVMFCGIMNLPPPPTKFTKFNNNLLQAARETCKESMAEAVHEAVEENEGGRDIAVAVDGSWQKRGFSSKNGVVTVTSVDTGKVIDVEILSKHCICPNKTKHLQNCKRNFVGYSGKMENRALRIIASAPVYIPRRVLHDDLRIPSIPNQIRKNSVNFQKSVRLHSNPSIQQQTDPGPSTTYRFPHLATQCPSLFPD